MHAKYFWKINSEICLLLYRLEKGEERGRKGKARSRNSQNSRQYFFWLCGEAAVMFIWVDLCKYRMI